MSLRYIYPKNNKGKVHMNNIHVSINTSISTHTPLFLKPVKCFSKSNAICYNAKFYVKRSNTFKLLMSQFQWINPILWGKTHTEKPVKIQHKTQKVISELWSTSQTANTPCTDSKNKLYAIVYTSNVTCCSALIFGLWC